MLTLLPPQEFALFLKKRAQLEEDHSNGIRKLSKTTADTMLQHEHNQGTFGQAYREMMGIHDKMANNGYQFAMSLHQMHEDLLELAAIAEKNRKGWKQNGLAAEQRVADVETQMRKSKTKYDQLADDYDRARTGDTSGSRGGFRFKGPRSAAQHEEDLLRKVQAADQDYAAKVQTLQAERGELVRTTPPRGHQGPPGYHPGVRRRHHPAGPEVWCVAPLNCPLNCPLCSIPRR